MIALGADCNGIYLGNETLHQQLITEYHPRPLFLIAERNSQCIIGSSFCMNIITNNISFSVNLDLLTRSGVRVNPDVLLLAVHEIIIMNKDTAKFHRPTFKSTLRRISITSVVIIMVTAWLLLSVASLLTLKQYAQKNLELLSVIVTRSLKTAVVFHDGTAAH
jgi:hypothetical protein